MRTLLLAALLAAAALPVVAGSAAACHPSIETTQGTEERFITIRLDMGCGHEPPYDVCVSVTAPEAEVPLPCGPVP